MKSLTLKLNQREKTLLQVLVAIILIAIIYYLIISPIIGFIQSSDEELKTNVENINRLENLYSSFRKIQQKKSRYISLLNRKNENITSLVEQWANSTGIARNIAYTRRTQSVIQNKYIRVTTNIKLEGVAIQLLLRFLYEIETSNKLLKISYFRIYRGLKGTKTYDVNFKIDSFTTK